MKCPICDKIFDPEKEDGALPFCSVRCKMIDANRWLNEEYSVETINDEALEREILHGEASAPTPNPETDPSSPSGAIQ